jgi:hypothetical protein
MGLLGLRAKKSPKRLGLFGVMQGFYLMAFAAMTMLAKITALDSKTALAEKTQKNKRVLLWADFRGMGWALS